MMEWTKTTPTEPGWYWIKNLFNSWFGEIRIVYVDNHINDNLIVYEVSEMNWIPINNYVGLHWQGPLPIPEKPEGRCDD